jgi:hypothetical protein
VAATALVALGLIGADDPITVQTIRMALADHRDIVRWGAAIALARLHGPATSASAVTELLAWTGGDSDSRAEVPYLDGDLAGYAGLALRQVGDDHAQTTFDALLARIPAVSGPPALPIVGEALRRAFPHGTIAADTPFAALDRPQQRLLRALADSPSTWGIGEFENFGNFGLMLSAYGLPHDVHAMRSYIG